ncbi:hypothetical protein ACLKA7_002101 [Drosophila subpalustris]
MNSEDNISLASSQKQLKGNTSYDNMTDVNWAAYNAFRCDLAKVQKTFASCTQTDFTEEVGTLTDTSLGCNNDMESSDAQEQLPQGSSSNVGEEPLKILLEARDKRGLPHKTKSESSCELHQSNLVNPSEIRGSKSDHLSPSPQPSLSVSEDVSCCSSISTIGSARLTESQTSGYTTESSYQTATAGSTSSFLSQPLDLTTAHNYLREIHVRVETSATNHQIQEIRSDLRSLLSNEVALISLASGGSRQAVYLIAYTFM